MRIKTLKNSKTVLGFLPFPNEKNLTVIFVNIQEWSAELD